MCWSCKGGKSHSWKADGNMLFSTSMGNLATDTKIMNVYALCPEVSYTYFINILIQGRNKICTRLFIGVGCNSKSLETTHFSSVKDLLNIFL